MAFSPTVVPPIKWQGGAEFRFITPAPGAFVAYTIPAGRSFILSDLIVTNRGAAPVASFGIFAGAGGVCSGEALTLRIDDMHSPQDETSS